MKIRNCKKIPRKRLSLWNGREINNPYTKVVLPLYHVRWFQIPLWSVKAFERNCEKDPQNILKGGGGLKKSLHIRRFVSSMLILQVSWQSVKARGRNRKIDRQTDTKRRTLASQQSVYESLQTAAALYITQCQYISMLTGWLRAQGRTRQRGVFIVLIRAITWARGWGGEGSVSDKSSSCSWHPARHSLPSTLLFYTLCS